MPDSLAAFGKHPAWDDHIDDIGLNTETLALTKQRPLFGRDRHPTRVRRLGPAREIRAAIEFDHRFVWGRDQQAIVGAIWASADRKRRTRFPLIICAQAGLEGPQASRPFARLRLEARYDLQKCDDSRGTLERIGRAQCGINSRHPPSIAANLFSEVADAKRTPYYRHWLRYRQA